MKISAKGHASLFIKDDSGAPLLHYRPLAFGFSILEKLVASTLS